MRDSPIPKSSSVSRKEDVSAPSGEARRVPAELTRKSFTGCWQCSRKRLGDWSVNFCFANGVRRISNTSERSGTPNCRRRRQPCPA
jgi:hypothetical protein